MKTVGYTILFAVIQLVSLVLSIIGLPICAAQAWFLPNVAKTSVIAGKRILSFPKWFWLWSNDEDGIYPIWYSIANPTWSYQKVIFMWTALRNPVNNLRFVPGVSAKGRPLYYRTWLVKLPNGSGEGKQFYAKAGWLSNGYPCLSAGAGSGF